MRALILAAVLALSTACVPPPAHLSPAATAAFNNTRAIHALDLVRDTAIAANAQTPPVLSEAVTRKVVEFHEAALKVMHAAGSGWKATVGTALDELAKALSPADRALLAPYLALVNTILAEVP